MRNLKRRNVDVSELYWQDPLCGNCYVHCVDLDEGWWGCPECGTRWDNYGSPNEFEDWPDDNYDEIENSEELPPLMDGFYTIRENAQVTIVENDEPIANYLRFTLMIDDHEYCYTETKECAQQRAAELRDKIKAHYALKKEMQS